MYYYEPIPLKGAVLWRRRSTEDEVTILNLPTDLYQGLKMLAELRGMTIETFVEHVLGLAAAARKGRTEEPPKY